MSYSLLAMMLMKRKGVSRNVASKEEINGLDECSKEQKVSAPEAAGLNETRQDHLDPYRKMEHKSQILYRPPDFWS